MQGKTNDEFPGGAPPAKPKATRGRAAGNTPVTLVSDSGQPAGQPAEVQAVVAAPKPSLLQRMSAVQSEVDYIQKERKQGMRYTIVSHDAVTAKVRPILVKHGVFYFPMRCARTQMGNRTEVDMTTRFVNVDDATDFIDVQTSGYGIDDQDKGPGKAISYAVKYALLKALGLETGDDPDLEQDVTLKPGPAVQAGTAPGAPIATTNGKGTAHPPAQAAAETAVKQKAADEEYVEGLVLRMAKATTRDHLLKLHNETQPRRAEIAERNPDVYKVYNDSMKERASEIDAANLQA